MYLLSNCLNCQPFLLIHLFVGNTSQSFFPIPGFLNWVIPKSTSNTMTSWFPFPLALFIANELFQSMSSTSCQVYTLSFAMASSPNCQDSSISSPSTVFSKKICLLVVRVCLCVWVGGKEGNVTLVSLQEPGNLINNM